MDERIALRSQMEDAGDVMNPALPEPRHSTPPARRRIWSGVCAAAAASNWTRCMTVRSNWTVWICSSGKHNRCEG